MTFSGCACTHFLNSPTRRRSWALFSWRISLFWRASFSICLNHHLSGMCCIDSPNYKRESSKVWAFRIVTKLNALTLRLNDAIKQRRWSRIYTTGLHCLFFVFFFLEKRCNSRLIELWDSRRYNPSELIFWMSTDRELQQCMDCRRLWYPSLQKAPLSYIIHLQKNNAKSPWAYEVLISNLPSQTLVFPTKKPDSQFEILEADPYLDIGFLFKPSCKKLWLVFKCPLIATDFILKNSCSLVTIAIAQ